MSKIHDVLYQLEEYRSLTAWIRETNYFCAQCRAFTEPSNRTVDHITPLSILPGAAFVRANLQMLCIECHKEKTRIRDNHFNNTMMLAFARAQTVGGN